MTVFILVADGHYQCTSGRTQMICKNAFATREAAEAEKTAFLIRCKTLDNKHLDALGEDAEAFVLELPMIGKEEKVNIQQVLDEQEERDRRSKHLEIT